jgi:zinc transport system ATP-binding protein
MRSPVTVRELVAAGRAPVERIWGPLSTAGREKVEWAVAQVGLAGELERPVGSLSGGQQQRAFLAKLLAAEPALLALDEPTAGVDADAQERLGELLAALHRELEVTILYVSHEFGAVEEHVGRLLLVRGGVAFDGPPAGLPGLWHDPSHSHPRGAAC